MEKTLTKGQRYTIMKLRALIDGIPLSIFDDTRCLISFLKARDFKVKEAAIMILNHARWREVIQVEHLLTDFETPEVLTRYFPMSFLGYDKEGAPVRYLEYQNLDENGLYKCGNFSQLRKFFIKELETDIKRFKQNNGKDFPQIVHIHNVSQISFTRFTNPTNFHAFHKIAMDILDNYPEHLKALIIINAHWAFATFFNKVKQYLGSSIMKKILIFGADGWKEELLRRIDADVLPAFLGGTKTDPDGNPLCLSTINHGGAVPQEYFTEKDTDKFSKNPGVIAATIKHGELGRKEICVLTIPFEVAEPNCIINWEFMVQSHDLGFGLSLKTKAENPEVLIPIHKVETERVPERGLYRCKSPGSYFVIFDNSYSRIRSKKVFYRIWTTPTV